MAKVDGSLPPTQRPKLSFWLLSLALPGLALATEGIWGVNQ